MKGINGPVRGSLIPNTLAPFLTILFSKLLDYLADNSDEIVKALKDLLLKEHDQEIANAINDLGFEPNEDTLSRLYNVVEKKKKNTEDFASLLLTKAKIDLE